jgi:hypothetical protein
MNGIKNPLSKSELKWQRIKRLTSLLAKNAKANLPNTKKGCPQLDACAAQEF